MKKTLETTQIKFWKSKFGDEYLSRHEIDFDDMYRNTWGISRTELNLKFLSRLNRDSRILEVGCSSGKQLELLRKIGFKNLWGIDINATALTQAKQIPDTNIVYGSVLDIPFKDGYFDIVFTSCVLIHIHPHDLPHAIDEIYHVSRRYICGFEYYSPSCTPLKYRGYNQKLWKNDFASLFLARFPQLKLIKTQPIKYLIDDNIDKMYMLKKNAS